MPAGRALRRRRGRGGTLHHQACLAARPDPAALAERLFAWELESDLDIFDRAAVRYADVLGEAGLDRYRELAEERWATVPELGPGDSDRDAYGGRFRITRIMEALAELSGDLEQRVAVRSRDLSQGYDSCRSPSCTSSTTSPRWRWSGSSVASRRSPSDPIRGCERSSRTATATPSAGRTRSS
jgi:hypothetical protein